MFNRRVWKTNRLALLLTFLMQLPVMAQQKVDLELILIADSSGDIDGEDFLLVRHGYARALRDPVSSMPFVMALSAVSPSPTWSGAGLPCTSPSCRGP